jgi:hypothetical protein
MKIKTLFVALALLLFFSTCKSPTSPDNRNSTPTTGTIIGTVSETGTNSAIVGASVSTVPATSTVTTNPQGAYTISSVSPGAYTLTASASSHISNTTNISVTAGQTTTANLTLQADYSGSWSGTTSQGRNISFTIVGNAISQFSFGYEVSAAGIIARGTLTINYSAPQSISGNTFTISGTKPDFSWQMAYVFNGTFSSLTAASGTMTFTLSGPSSGSVSGTWTANKS